MTRNIIPIWLAVLAVATLLVTDSCKKTNSSSSSSNMSATVGSTSWNSTLMRGSYLSTIYSFELEGVKDASDTTIISLYFDPPTTVGLAVSSDTNYIDVGYFDSKTGLFFDGSQYGGHTIITITSWDTTNLKIAGTFSGVLYAQGVANDSMAITNGKFSTSYDKQ